MCGIAALFRSRGRGPGHRALAELTERVRHRGPDGEGVDTFVPDDRGELVACAGDDFTVGLGHRRLSILDLSAAGRQPMHRGSLSITFNGEIYNFVELRTELERLGHRFVSGSDTEVILAAFEAWGPACFARLRGMWGFVLVDRARRRAWLCRDRLGIKPVYLARGAGWLAVVSEPKQLRALDHSLRPDLEALRDYLDTGYEEDRRTFFRDVLPLPAGTSVELDLDTLREESPLSYWNPALVGVTIHDPEEAARRFSDALHEAVRLHLRSDVPVGCALSGGLDSTTVAALSMQVRPVDAPSMHGFTATFPGAPIDEGPLAADAARALGLVHHTVTPGPERLLEELDAFTFQHDEPVGSISQYAGWCVARLTRETGVPVTLNGQGGDEVLSGYWQSYFMHLVELARGRHVLTLARHLVGALGPRGNPELLRQAPVMLRRFLARRASSSGARLVGSVSRGAASRRIHEIRTQYLPRLLRWDDRNFMAFAVEGRYPFLDHVVIETALSISPQLLYDRGFVKAPMRQGLGSLLPAAIRSRRTKLGFETPQQGWLRGALREPIRRWLAEDAPIFEHVPRVELRSLADEVERAKAGHEEASQALVRAWLADRWMRVACTQSNT